MSIQELATAMSVFLAVSIPGIVLIVAMVTLMWIQETFKK